MKYKALTDKLFLVSKAVVAIATLTISSIGLSATAVQAAGNRNGVDGLDGLHTPKDIESALKNALRPHSLRID